MLYDPKWEVQAKPDVFSLESLIAWLEKMPADGAYDYTECRHCLLTRYFTAMGFSGVAITPCYIEHDDDTVALPDGFDEIAVGPHRQMPERGKAWGWTFGGALSRARSLAALPRDRSHAA